MDCFLLRFHQFSNSTVDPDRGIVFEVGLLAGYRIRMIGWMLQKLPPRRVRTSLWVLECHPAWASKFMLREVYWSLNTEVWWDRVSVSPPADVLKDSNTVPSRRVLYDVASSILTRSGCQKRRNTIPLRALAELCSLLWYFAIQTIQSTKRPKMSNPQLIHSRKARCAPLTTMRLG